MSKRLQDLLPMPLEAVRKAVCVWQWKQSGRGPLLPFASPVVLTTLNPLSMGLSLGKSQCNQDAMLSLLSSCNIFCRHETRTCILLASVAVTNFSSSYNNSTMEQTLIYLSFVMIHNTVEQFLQNPSRRILLLHENSCYMQHEVTFLLTAVSFFNLLPQPVQVIRSCLVWL